MPRQGEMTENDVNLEVVSQVIREAGRPVHINVLARATTRARLEAEAGVRHYAPGARYQAGETVLFGDQRATVKSVQKGGNPVQGPFAVLTLLLPDGTERFMAAEVPEAPAEDRQPVTEAQVDEALRNQGAETRQAVQAVLAADPRFVPCQTLQGNIWCLAEMLPSVSQTSLQRVLVALPKELSSEEAVSLTTEELVSTVWGLEDDGSNAYALRAFALRQALDGIEDLVSLGDRWTSAQAWEALTTRQTLDGPQGSTEVLLPDGIDAVTGAQIEQEQRREAAGEGEETEVEEPGQEDMETWRLDRPVHAVFTLRARHYYEGWLPLSKQVRRLFPPLASGQQEVVFHHHFGDDPTSLRAFVDRDAGRIWVSTEMHETFRRHRIYPGARLRLSARNEREYDIATRETDRTDPIRVWRMWLDEEGRIEYEEHEEPRRYDVADDVYVADVRFEDREALFRQAEEVGNSIFGLMYQQTAEWWEAGGRGELVVTPDRLFESIHFDEQGRMVSKATIAWELWQRLAFVPLGGGRYRFRPEFGDYLRSAGLAPRRRRCHQRKTEPISECWAQVARLAGQELQTLAQKRPFCVLEVSDNSLQVQLKDSGETWSIQRKKIEAAWEHLVREGGISRADIQERYLRFNLAYVTAILAALPDVTHQTRPIRLMYQPPSEEPPVSTLERTRTGQLVAADLVSPGPLFEQSPQPLQPDAPDVSVRAERAKPSGLEPSPEGALLSQPDASASGDLGPTDPTHPPTPPSLPLSSEEPAESPPPSQPPPPPPSPPPRRSRSSSKPLFSQHYLTHRIQDHSEWDDEISEPFRRLRALYEEKRGFLSTLNEAQTEAEFIRPALEILGFAYIPQTTTRRAGRVQRPDYALFADDETKAGAYPFQEDNEPAFYARALAIADAKYWERPLSETRREDPRDVFKNSNPSFQIVNYLTGTGVDWGILTNGRLWRLYYRQASSTATEFYEVDLVEALESGDWEQRFKYFWLFFRQDAFVKDTQGRNFLERVREGSATYARMVGDRLKERVFEEVFPFLSRGFVAHRAARGEDVRGEESRRVIYEATLSLLYKMLFLLYAEARHLLPIDNAGYRAQSLTRMARQVVERADRAEPLGSTSTALYDRLLNLFRLIDRGDPGLGLPRYNGGLFHFDFDAPADPLGNGNGNGKRKHGANWFLTQNRVPDAFLAPALDLLYRADGEPVDYGYIGVRHLGAIYEGLLEHRLVVQDVETSEVFRDFGSLEYSVHLETGKGERKATGSYYTPDYIVKYIVRHTVGPILEEHARRFDELMGRIAGVRRQLADGRRSASIHTLRGELDRLEHQAREALLDIKICDPAMGSGHFLVEAVDFLTDGLIEILNRYPEHNPVLALLDLIRREIVASLQHQGIPVDPARLNDTQLLQRVVMKRCIYGVDLNPMAVELAKVSLWLHSFTIGAPLSFLDHHLRCGNSLIGTMAQEAHEQLSSEMPLFGGPFAGLLRAAEIMRGISILSDATFAEVEESERLFRQFDEAAKPYKRLLDIFVARHFGVKRADEFLRLYGADAIQAGPESVGQPYAEVMHQARQLYEEKRFFHWDLEFPEVFIDLERATWKENPGFDVVVGNPPWGASLDKASGLYINTRFQSARGNNDTYTALCENSVGYLKLTGRVGLIMPDAWTTGASYQPMREKLLSSCRVTNLVGLPYDVFQSAYVDCMILVAEKVDEPQPNEVAITCIQPHEQPQTVISNPERIQRVSSRYWLSDEKKTIRMTWGEVHYRVSFRVTRQSEEMGRLVELAGGVTAYGASGHPSSKGRIFHSDYKKSDEWIPFFMGSCRRYTIEHRIEQYLHYGEHLVSYPELRFFHGQRLQVRRMISRQFRMQASITAGHYAIDDSSYFGLQRVSEYDLAYILSILNSRLLSWFQVSGSAIALRDDYPKLTLAETRRLPIRHIAFTTPSDERARLVEEGLNHEEPEMERMTRNVQSPFVPFASFRAFRDSRFGHWLDARLSAQPEQSDVVHDLLAHLAGQMIEMNKEKQAEVKGFLAWLEREIGAPIDNLTRKTHLRNYLGDYQKGESHRALEEVLDILRRNRRRLKVDPSERAFQEQLAGEYEGSLGKLLPLKARLAGTDRLIDLIVYRLYGLTEEEITVVEGTE